MSTRSDDVALVHDNPGWALDPGEIARLTRTTLAPGVTSAELWASGHSHAGLMWLEPGARLEEHTHTRHAHHVWVVAGGMETLDRSLAAGSYALVPPGQRHGLRAGAAGVTLFYLYLEVS